MKRTTVRIEEIADLRHLSWAFWRAAQGKRMREEVRLFENDLDRQLSSLARDLLDETVELGCFRQFEIRDPKRRTIHAPCFRERVLHHALMAKLEPTFERAHVDDTFACRPGRGSLTAVRRAQHHARRWPWFAKLDVRSYFASIDHEIFARLIRRRIRGGPVLRLVDRILATHHANPGRGLPIGALTSQHFANLYLAPIDRFLLETIRVPGMVRYMDDTVLWHRDREAARRAAEAMRVTARERLGLEIKAPYQVGRSDRGLTFCGFRVFPGRLGLNARRRKRYRMIRRRWERAYATGRVDGRGLQGGVAAAIAMTLPADAEPWRRQELATRPALDA